MVHWATKSQKSEAYWLKNKEHEVYKNDNFFDTEIDLVAIIFGI